jgi:Tfp pilus assembly protein PilN
MKAIHLDLAPYSFGRLLLRTPRATWAIGLFGIVMVALAAASLTAEQGEWASREAEIERVKADLQKRGAHQPAVKRAMIPEPQLKSVNEAITQLNLPWRDLLDALEVSAVPGVALLALEPDAKKRLLKGSAEAKSSEDMLAYIDQLKQQSFFNFVVLTKHEVREQDKFKPWRFQFEARWREATL